MKPFEEITAEPYEQKKKVYSVTQLNREARMILESRFATVWLEAEISGLKKHTSGHFYLSLKDDKSQISAVFFSRYNMMLRFDIKDGLQVMVMGKISLYEPRGQYQFFIERMEPKGMGSLQLAFLQLKEKLEKEGLFEESRKKPIPRFPRTVGIVTSATGAAIKDILNVMGRRFSGTEILLYPVQVQGAGSAEQIARAITDLNRMGGIDVMIVGRGGGSIEDLWAFNEEVVARAIAASRIPVISAVGHEIDWTIADLVADLRAPTPSAAAELVVQNQAELEKRLADLKFRMNNRALLAVRDAKRRLEDLVQSYAFKQPGILVQQFAQRVDELSRQLQNYLKSFLLHKSQAFGNAAGKLNALSPLAILERGYSVSFTENGKLLKDAGKVKPGDSIKTKLWRGTVHAKVTRVDSEGDGV